MKPSSLSWRKSPRSQSQSNCVELAALPSGGLAVRDSKLGERGPVLAFGRGGVAAFLRGAGRGEFDGPA
ncbi:DUF397 domain-containing protein [Saccharothrix xinjiangensis]|uniref:DUF397 domain-containing protein n=1 Tax=Saccharothrix xinjiangensis TaxID=204798 RepID=A0ABV9Y0R8_9PSEU